METAAFVAVTEILRSDSDLRRVGLTLRAWDGAVEDAAPPTLARLPFLRITPAPSSSAWESEGQHRFEMTLNLDVVVQGTRAANLLNLWGAIRSALFPSDPVRRAEVEASLQTAGVVQGTLTQSAIRAKLLEGDQHALAASGALKLTLLVAT